jgi:regulator of protease activity HflC (stomatin/prohibitin superfamily)
VQNVNFRLIAFGLAALVLLMVASGFYFVVDTGTRGVVLRFGAINRVESEGLHAKIPFIENVVIMTVRVQKETTKTEAASKDLQSVHTTIVLNFNLDAKKAGDVYRELGADYAEKVIDPVVKEGFKAAAARYTAEDLISKREALKTEVRDYLKSRLSTFGIDVVELSITDFDFSAEFSKTIESKQVAEQLALKAKRDLDRIRVEAQQKIATAQAEAESLRIQRQVISPDLIKLRQIETQMKAIEKWDGKLPSVTGGSVPFIQIEKEK